MKYYDLEKIAYDYLLTDDFKGIYHAAECEDCYVFDGGDPDMDWYGLRSVKVDKKSGEPLWYDPTLLNITKKDLPIDDEFRFKKEQ